MFLTQIRKPKQPPSNSYDHLSITRVCRTPHVPPHLSVSCCAASLGEACEAASRCGRVAVLRHTQRLGQGGVGTERRGLVRWQVLPGGTGRIRAAVRPPLLRGTARQLVRWTGCVYIRTEARGRLVRQIYGFGQPRRDGAGNSSPRQVFGVVLNNYLSYPAKDRKHTCNFPSCLTRESCCRE